MQTHAFTTENDWYNVLLTSYDAYKGVTGLNALETEFQKLDNLNIYLVIDIPTYYLSFSYVSIDFVEVIY